HIMSAIDRSLRRLSVEYVDLYIINRWDPETPIEETLDALNDLVRMGKVRYLGASSMHAHQFIRALSLQDRYRWSRFVSLQNLYNLVYREEETEMLPLCEHERIALTPWGALAAGRLARPAESGSQATSRARTDRFAHESYSADCDLDVVKRCNEVAH